MRPPFALVIVALCAGGGCGFDVPAAAASDDDGPRDAAIDGDGDGAITDGPDGSVSPGDRDRDGVPDSSDNCPDVANVMQRDHDADGHGDECDRCPHLADAADPDMDNDGVGDACDPHPATPGDHRALWIGFWDEDQATFATWTRVGPWTISGGWAHVTPMNSIDSARTPAIYTKAVVTTRMKLDDYSASGAAAGLVTAMTFNGGNLDQFYQCVLFKSGSVNARTGNNGNTVQDSNVAWAGALSAGTVLDVTARIASSFTCTFAAPATTSTSQAAGPAGRFELIEQSASVSYDYVFVVEQP